MQIYECKNEYMGNVNVKNEYMGNVNVRSECGNGGMLGDNALIGENIWMNVR